jgi:hypothetical protein
MLRIILRTLTNYGEGSAAAPDQVAQPVTARTEYVVGFFGCDSSVSCQMTESLDDVYQMKDDTEY